MTFSDTLIEVADDCPTKKADVWATAPAGLARAPRLQVISPARQGLKRPGLEPGWSVVCHQLSDPPGSSKQEVQERWR